MNISNKPAMMASDLLSLKLLGRGKACDTYEVGHDNLLRVVPDRISAFDVPMDEPIPGKGQVLTAMSRFWLIVLKDIIPNHFTQIVPEGVVTPDEVDQVRNRSMVVKRLEPVLIEAVVRGYLAGSGWTEYQASGAVCGISLPKKLRNGSRLAAPIFTPSTKAPKGEHDENISFERMSEIVGIESATTIREVSLKLYIKAAEIALAKGIIVADTKFEFGLDTAGDLVLMDEVVTPDSSRFWPVDGYEAAFAQGLNPPSFDKQFLRDWLATATVEGKPWNKKAPAPTLPEDVVAITAAKYKEALRLLTS